MMTQIKVVRTDLELECPDIDRCLREAGVNLVLLPDGIDEATLLRETRDADLILMCYTPITAKVITQAKHLKGIVKYGVGIDAIDIDAARARNIPVVNIPEYAEQTVAEGAFTLLIALAKKLVPMQVAMQSKGWTWPTQQWLGSDIAGKTIGLVGVGKIGQSMARMAGRGFGAKVLGFDPNMSRETMQMAGVEKCDDLIEMLETCDFVSIHCVLNKDTHHLIDKQQMQAMKHTAILINTSRGAIVDEAALVQALKDGSIAGAGLDVYSIEPLNRKTHPMRALFDMDNVILTPHLTFYTKEAMQRLEAETLERCFELLAGNPVLIKSKDPRLLAQQDGVTFAKAGSCQDRREPPD